MSFYIKPIQIKVTQHNNLHFTKGGGGGGGGEGGRRGREIIDVNN